MSCAASIFRNFPNMVEVLHWLYYTAHVFVKPASRNIVSPCNNLNVMIPIVMWPFFCMLKKHASNSFFSVVGFNRFHLKIGSVILVTYRYKSGDFIVEPCAKPCFLRAVEASFSRYTRCLTVLELSFQSVKLFNRLLNKSTDLCNPLNLQLLKKLRLFYFLYAAGRNLF